MFIEMIINKKTPIILSLSSSNFFDVEKNSKLACNGLRPNRAIFPIFLLSLEYNSFHMLQGRGWRGCSRRW